MAEEAQSHPPILTAEIHVGDAIWALTTENAIFRNGRQVVIPHIGVDFMAELLAALSTDEFKEGFVTNRIDSAEVTQPDPMQTPERDPMKRLRDRKPPAATCELIHPPTGFPCFRPAGHMGNHWSMVPGPEQDDFEWHEDDYASKESIPSRVTETNWEGFEVHPIYVERVATIRHIRSALSVVVVDVNHANGMLRDATLTEYDRLCARAYLAWYDQTFPTNFGTEG